VKQVTQLLGILQISLLTITDFTVNNPTYYVERNSLVVVTNQTWTSGENITINVDGLTPDEYNYTIVYTDGFGEIYTNTVLVTVIVNENPTISSPEDITFTEDDPLYSVEWSIFDFTYVNLTFEIFQNGTSTGLVYLPDSTHCTLNVGISHLTVGSHNYTIEVKDGLGGIANDTVWIFVLLRNETTITPTTVISSFTSGLLSLTMLVSVSIAIIVIYKRRKK